MLEPQGREIVSATGCSLSGSGETSRGNSVQDRPYLNHTVELQEKAMGMQRKRGGESI